MPASRLIILGVAVAAAGGAGYVAKKMTARPPAQIVVSAGPREPQIALTDVLVLSEDVPVGGTLDSQMRWEQWPADGLNDTFITRDKQPDAMQKLKGSVARIAMYAGEPVRRSKLVGEGKSLMSSILPSGMRAVATQISAETSAGGFILPNDRVDVIMTRRADKNGSAGGANGDGFITETILKNIRVLAIDQTIQEDEEGKKTKVGTTATLELTPEQAEIITVAQQMADKLALALRSVADTQEKPSDQADYLVSGNGRRGTVRLVKAGEVSEVGAKR